MVPGQSAVALVALAEIGGTPASSRAGKEIKLPPPATELIAPAAMAARKRVAICIMLIAWLNSHTMLATVQLIIDWRRLYQDSCPVRRCVFVSTATVSPCSGSATS